MCSEPNTATELTAGNVILPRVTVDKHVEFNFVQN